MYAERRRARAHAWRLVLRFLLAIGLLAAAGPTLASPEILHWQTANGAEVYFVRAPGLPMVDLRVVFHAGSAHDGAKPGVAALTNRMLLLGAGGLSADAIAQRFDQAGAEVRNGSERDMAWVALRSLTAPAQMGPVSRTLARVLAHPDFRSGDLDRERKHQLVAIERQDQSPTGVANKALFRAVYGEHPYASPSLGTKASVQALNRADVMRFYRRYYVGRNAVVAIVGDLDRKSAATLAETVVGGLPAGAPAPALPPVQPLTKGRTIRIHHPSTQTTVLMGQPGDYRGDPDYFPLYVGNHALGGGGLVSLLNDEIREKRGLAYSVFSYFMPMARKGPFMMGTQTRNDQTAQTIKVMNDTVRRFLEHGITAKQLADAKKNITGGFPLRIDSNKKIVEYIAMIGFYHLPLDYLDRFSSKVEAVSRRQVNDALRRRLQPARMVTVIVGGGV